MYTIPIVASVVIYAVLYYFFWFRVTRCDHTAIVCLHDDEIKEAGGHRSQCLLCDKTFWDLPMICFYTGDTHLEYIID